MNLLLLLGLLGVGAPTPASFNIGPWIHFIWVIVIVCLIVFVVVWGWSKIGAKVPEPLHTILVVLGVLALCALVIIFILIPLMGVF